MNPWTLIPILVTTLCAGSPENITLKIRMKLLDTKGNAVPGAYAYPGEVIYGKQEGEKVIFATLSGTYTLLPDRNGKLPDDAIKIDVSELEPYHEGMGTDLPIVKVSATQGGKVVVVHVYQPIHTDEGKVFQHHVASFSKPMKGKSLNFSILRSLPQGKLRALDSHLDRRIEEDGGLEYLVVEIAVWDDAQRRILATHRGEYSILAD